MVLDEAAALLGCSHCGYRTELPRGEAIVWHDFDGRERPASPDRAEEGDGPVTLSCAHCGAVVIRRPGALALHCHYCLSNLALEPTTGRMEAFDGIVPFLLDGRTARQKFAGWLGAAWFAPGDLARAARVEELDSIYVPCHFWRAQAKTSWSARVGILTTAAEDAAAGRARPSGDPGHVRTRWEDQRGVIDEPIHELESASRVVATQELLELGGFAAAVVVGYHQGYLGSHDAELPVVSQGESHARLRARIERLRADRAESSIEAERHKDFRSETELERSQVRLALVPLYVVAYRYQKDVFRVLVHGASGTVTGDHPVSPWKVGFLVACLLAVGLALLAAFG